MPITQRHPARSPIREAVQALFMTSMGLIACAQAGAQAIPDAGQILQQNRSLPEAPKPPVPLPAPTKQDEVLLSGGAQVTVTSVQFNGNQSIDSDTLGALMKPAIGQKHDLASLRALVDMVGASYREAGFLFARAYLPPQDLATGVLRIEILEGRYGKAEAKSTQLGWAEAAQPYLDSLVPDAVIERDLLGRVTLLLSDLPGVVITPVMQPGEKVGTGDLVVDVARSETLTGSVALDNHGSRYSGQHRASLALDWLSPSRLGDRISMRALASEDKLWLGSLTYSTELGSTGWRGSASMSNTHYELGKEFAALEAKGSAVVFGAGVSNALLRSNEANIKMSATYQRKDLNDKQGALRDSKSVDSVVLQADFDRRYAYAGLGGITYGSFSFTHGRLNLPSDLLARDLNGTAGLFGKLNLDVVALQSISPSLNGYARLTAQWANKNLDSSERMALGGASGVRAYPSGEGSGDQGWVVQVELRSPIGAAEPYVFADAGGVQFSTKQVGQGVNNRSLSGAGLGTRIKAQGWELDLALAWRLDGGVALAEGGVDNNPRLTVSAGYRF